MIGSDSEARLGKVMSTITVTNATDVDNRATGLLPPDQVRSAEVEALVDTGATMLCLPADLVARLGLPLREMRKVRLANGAVEEVACVSHLDVRILGRTMSCDALVLPTGSTPLIGQLQLEALDLIVDPKNRELRVNPASPDVPLLDLLYAA